MTFLRVSLPNLSVTCVCALAVLGLFAAPAALRATDPTLDTAFVTAISPGLTPDGYVPPPASPNWLGGTGAVNAVALQSDGKIIAGGNISRYQAPAPGSPQTSLKRLNPDGSFDTLTSFNTTAATLADSQGQTEVNKILTIAGDKLYVGGVFTSYNGVARGGLMRLNADGSLDADPATGFNAAGISNSNAFSIRYVLALAEQPDGKLLVGGGFNRANGTYRPNLARFNSDGSLDTSFNPNAVLGDSSFVGDIAVLPDGDILVGGGRNRAGGGGTPLLVRLNSDGSLDASLAPSFADEFGGIDEMVALPDGRIVIGGDFSFLPTGTSYNLACLLPDGSLDTAFMANLGSGPNGWAGGEVTLQPDGTLFVGGIFTTWNNQPRASIARLLPDGTLDTAFAPPPYVATTALGYSTHFYSFAFQPDGKLVAGGWFARVIDAAVESYNLTRFVNEYSPASPGTLRLVATTVSVGEDQPSATLQVSRYAGTTGDVTVDFTTLTGGANGTATGGLDFTSASGTLTWAAGESGVKSITVPLLADATVDGAKTFSVQLINPTGSPFLPTPTSRATVTILDADAFPSITTQPASVSLEQGARFSLSVRYDSVLAATVQWQRDPDGGGPLPYADIPGATSTVYTVTTADSATHSGTYRAVITNPNGTTPGNGATVSISVPAGSLVTTFAPAAGTPIVSTAAQDSSGRFLIAHSSGLRRLGADGTLEPTTSFGITVSTITSILPLADGRTLIGGNFGTLTHQPSSATSTVGSRLVRLNADATGTIDTSYSPPISGPVQTLAPGASGKFYVGSTVTLSASGGNIGLQRFLANGSTDTTFTPPFFSGSGTYSVKFIHELSPTQIIAIYSFSGSTGDKIVRFNVAATTPYAVTLDTTFGTAGIFSLTVNNPINGLSVLPDGRIAFSTFFSNLIAPDQQYVGLLNADGTPDTTFKFNNVLAGGRPKGLAYRDGRLLVWGDFTTVNGANQATIARVNLDGSVDSTFSVGVGAASPFDRSINRALYASTGEIFIAGKFNDFKGVARNNAALLVGNPQIGAIGFTPPRLSVVEGNQTLSLTLRRYGPATEAASIAYATADGTALAGSDYTATSGTVSWAAGDSADKFISIALLDDAAIEATETFTVTLSSPTGPVGPAGQATLTLIDSDTPVTFTAQPAGSSLISAGSLTLSATVTSPSPITYQWLLNGVAISGATTATFAKNPVTTADAGVYTLAATNAAGTLTSTPALVGISPQPGRPSIGQATSGRPTFSTTPTGLVVADDGYVYVSGSFTASAPNNIPQANFLRIKPDGSTDLTYTYTPGAAVTALARQADGKILLAGSFTHRVVRLNGDGTFDTAFATALGSSLNSAGQVNDFAFDSTGRIYLGGTSFISRLSSDGTYDSAYAPAVNSSVTALAVQTDDKLLVAGSFSALAGSSAGRFGRLNTNGTRDATFVSGIGGSGIYNDLVVLADGRVLVAGSNFANSATLAGVNADGSFGANIAGTNQVYQIAQAPGGKVLVTRTHTTASSRLFRLLDANPFPSTSDTTFNIGTGPDADARLLAIGPDGGIWIAGTFTTVNGVTTGGIAKLNGDPLNPAIVNPPVNTGVVPGGTAHLGVGAFGTGLTYQWLKDGTPLADAGHYSGVTTAILIIANADAADDANYTVQVTGGSPSTTVTSSPGHLYVLGAPVVATPPAAVDIVAGPALTVSAQIYAAAPTTFVWTRDGVPVVNDARISGASTASLAFTSTVASDTGTYALTITNAQGTATTSGYVLVRPVPTARVATFSGLSSSQSVAALHALPDGGMLVANIGGTLTNNSITTLTNRLQLVRADGTVANLGLDPANPGTPLPALGNMVVRTIFLQPDGKILLGGNDFPAGASLIRILPDGSRDPDFAGISGSTSSSSIIQSIALDDSGRILVGGDFTNLKGITGQNLLARLDPATGALDTTFVSGFTSGSLTRILKLPGANSGFLIGGVNIANPFTVSVRRYDASGTNVTSFISPSINANTLAFAPDGATFYAATQTAPYLARYRVADGSLDPAFVVPTGTFNNQINSLAVQPDGKVVAHGAFNTYPQTQVGRVLPNGAPDPTFLVGGTNTNSFYFPLALDSAGRIWFGGSFTTFNNATANRIAVLEGDLPALAWSAQPQPLAVAVGQTIAFTAATRATSLVTYQWFKDGQPLTNGGRLSGATSASLSITGATLADEGDYTVRATNATGTSIESDSAEFAFLAAPEITSMPAGRTAPAGAAFAAPATARGAGTLSYQWLRASAPVSGQTSTVLSLPAPSTTDTGWYQLRVTNTLGTITSAPVLFVFAQYAGTPAGGIAVPSISNTVSSIATLTDGGTSIAGAFSQLTPPGGTAQSAFGVARLTSTGAGFTPAPQVHSFFSFLGTANAGQATATVSDSQGRIIVAGSFDGVSSGGTGTARNSIARFNADGSLDTTWTSPAAAAVSGITCLAVDASDNIYVGGSFTNINSVASTRSIVRLGAATGTLDTSFLSPFTTNGTVNRILILSDGRLLVGGTFGIRLLETSGTLASGFSYTAGGSVNTLAALPGGDFLVGTTTGLQRITSAGALVSPFPATGTAANNAVRAIAPLADGRFVIAGNFTAYNSVTVGRIIVINADGTPNSSINFGTGFTDGQVNALSLDSQNRLWVGGAFTTYRGTTVGTLAVLATTNFTPEPPAPPVTTTPFEAFLIAGNVPVGQRSPTDDPDFDSVPNLLEFALGLAPMMPDSDGLPFIDAAVGELTLTYVRAQPSAVTYSVQTTTDLTNPASWTAIGVNQGSPAGNGVTTASIPLGAGAGFLRLNVTLNP